MQEHPKTPLGGQETASTGQTFNLDIFFTLSTSSRSHQSGFTLIEIAIVVVISGFLLGGILKGQEMIANARTHSLISQATAMQSSVAMFSDRFRALPGDYKKAATNIPGLNSNGTDNGNGDGLIGGDPDKTETADLAQRKKEAALVWRHLSATGIVAGQFDGNGDNIGADVTAANWGWECPATTCLDNHYSGTMFLVFDNEQYYLPADLGQDNRKSHQLWTGFPVPVEVLMQMDIKQDDGNPITGHFRVGDLFEKTAPYPGTCIVDPDGSDTTREWAVADKSTNCGGVHQM